MNALRKHYLSLDSIRGILACSVALAHFNGNSYFKDSTIIGRGDIYVDFFFVLSGFVIFANYRDRILNGFGIGRFMFLRLGRLYPLHFAVLMAFIVTDLFQMIVHINGAAAFAPFSAPGEGIKEILANLFLIHSMHTINTYAFNGPSWSISVEVFTYALFACILCLAKKYYRLTIAAISAISALVLFFVAGELYAKLDYGFLRCVYGFGVGSLAYDAFEFINRKRRGCCVSQVIVNATEIFVTVLTFIYIGLFSFDGASMFAPIIFFFVIIMFAYEGGIVSKVLKTRPLIFIGTLSYSIYMIHIFISGKFFMFPARLLENWVGIKLTYVESNGVVMMGLDRITGTLLEVFYLIVVIACSWISYRFIEEPFRKYSKRIVFKNAVDKN